MAQNMLYVVLGGMQTTTDSKDRRNMAVKGKSGQSKAKDVLKGQSISASSQRPTEGSVASVKGKQRLVDEDMEDVSEESDISSSDEGDVSSGKEDEETDQIDFDKLRRKSVSATAPTAPPDGISLTCPFAYFQQHHALRQMSKAAKKSRQFEVQRLVKRLKASKNDAERPSVEGQLRIIKSLPLQQLAASALLAKLAKNRLLPRGAESGQYRTEEAKKQDMGVSEFPMLAVVWSEASLTEVWFANDACSTVDEEGKAKARLMSSKTLAEECGKQVEALARLCGRTAVATRATTAPADSSAKAAEAAKAEPTTSRQTPAERSERVWSGSEGEDSDVQEEEPADEASSSGSTSAPEDLDEDAMEQQVKELDDMAKWDQLMGHGSSGESDSEGEPSNQAKTTERQREKQRKRKRAPTPDDDDEDSESEGELRAAAQDEDDSKSDVDSEDDDDDDDDDDSASGMESDASSSKFLPSLSHGFINHALRTRDDDFSGGESDDDDIDENAEDRAGTDKAGKGKKKPERKNRMGQRARKALWEKKYGRNANHVKLKEKEKRKTERASSSSSKTAGQNGDRPAFKPLRRDRKGQVLPDFVPPPTLDTGWKRHPTSGDDGGKPSSETQSRNKKASTNGRPHSTNALAPQRSNEVVASRPAQVRNYQQPDSHGGHQHRAPSSSVPVEASSAVMHPSWIAKQKQKEKEEAIAKSLANGGGGAGKKVVFD